MKIYHKNYYTVIELSDEVYDSANEYILSSSDWDWPRSKVLLGNEREINYLSKLLKIKNSEIDKSDWIKLVKSSLLSDKT